MDSPQSDSNTRHMDIYSGLLQSIALPAEL